MSFDGSFGRCCEHADSKPKLTTNISYAPLHFITARVSFSNYTSAASPPASSVSPHCTPAHSDSSYAQPAPSAGSSPPLSQLSAASLAGSHCCYLGWLLIGRRLEGFGWDLLSLAEGFSSFLKLST